ncbi:MAG: hypothetical protein JNM31_11295 [Flavobacteriales bacterium]|nr:hypothetical protein [Flavobacteriales bacterium]
MRWTPAFLSILCACGGVPKAEVESTGVHGAPPLALPQVDDNIRHDTLMIQTTFNLGDGTYIMVASNITETFEGLRLHRYTANADSTATILAVSSPAYDSWTMLPTFFRDPEDSSAFLILANFGEKESWGQKMLKLDASGFHDLGFVDVALPERIMEDDTLRLKRRNIGPYARVTGQRNALIVTFATDSLYLYDDLRGGRDRVVPAKGVAYRFRHGEVELGIGKDFRAVKN